MRVNLLPDEMMTEGKSMRLIHDLKLVRSQTPSFMLTWTTMHQIDELSPPLWRSAEELKRTNTTLTIIFSGIDETVAQAVRVRHVYTHQDIFRNKQFVDMFFLFRR
jgi:inward rectifier potassium channel